MGGNNQGPEGNAKPGGQNPWGSGQGPQLPRPPEIDKLMSDMKRRYGSFMPGGGKSGRAIILLIILLIGGWALTGFYRAMAQQQGVVLRFGEWVRTTSPGLHYHLPSPIETVLTPEVTRENRLEIGLEIFKVGLPHVDIADDPMITGDENIVDIDFVVFLVSQMPALISLISLTLMRPSKWLLRL